MVKAKNASKQPVRAKRLRKRAGRGGQPGLVDRAFASNYMRLLADPCGAPFAHPPYGSVDSGYLVRTVENIPIQAGGYTGLTAGSVVAADFAIQVTPCGFSSQSGVLGGNLPGLSYAAIKSGSTLTLAAQASTCYIATQTAVRKFRPVACCLKFLPYGPYNSRQGLIGMGYNGGQFQVPNVGTYGVGALLTQCMVTMPLGAEKHEVKWLPTAIDQEWQDPLVTDTSQASGGSVLLVGAGVDATALTTTVAQINGYMEVTTVWEWTPATSSGLSVMAAAPSPVTIQNVLSTIGNIADFVLGVASTPTAQRLVTFGANYVNRRAMTPRIEL